MARNEAADDRQGQRVVVADMGQRFGLRLCGSCVTGFLAQQTGCVLRLEAVQAKLLCTL